MFTELSTFSTDVWTDELMRMTCLQMPIRSSLNTTNAHVTAIGDIGVDCIRLIKFNVRQHDNGLQTIISIARRRHWRSTQIVNQRLDIWTSCASSAAAEFLRLLPGPVDVLLTGRWNHICHGIGVNWGRQSSWRRRQLHQLVAAMATNAWSPPVFTLNQCKATACINVMQLAFVSESQFKCKYSNLLTMRKIRL